MRKGNRITTTLDVATLPLADGRRLLLPLKALAEVQQWRPADPTGGELGILNWRGYELPVTTLEELCGLAEPENERLTHLVVFKATKDAKIPFRAVALTSEAAHERIDAESLAEEEKPGEEAFVASARLRDQSYLIPDLPTLLFSAAQ